MAGGDWYTSAVPSNLMIGILESVFRWKMLLITTRSEMTFFFALIGAVVGLIPGGSFILIPMEVFLLWKIMHKNDAFDWMTFVVTAAGLIAASAILKGLASLLHAIPVIGQVANSLVAFGFIMILGSAADEHFKGRT